MVKFPGKELPRFPTFSHCGDREESYIFIHNNIMLLLLEMKATKVTTGMNIHYIKRSKECKQHQEKTGQSHNMPQSNVSHQTFQSCSYIKVMGINICGNESELLGASQTGKNSCMVLVKSYGQKTMMLSNVLASYLWSGVVTQLR